MTTFVALDFETANSSRDSACEIGIVRVERLKTVYQDSFLIKPPTAFFLDRFTETHGITWDLVKDQPTFGELWHEIRFFFEDVDFIAAHQASFDRSVLAACKQTYRKRIPDFPFLCTVGLTRKIWNIRPTTLPVVCRELGIKLKHQHCALDDALACSEIVIMAFRENGGRRIISELTA
jgi:DNA polymerase-3 subunit epsilon